MTTATTASPLETYRQGRDQVLSVLLETMTGLETSVLEFQHQHEGQARTVGTELSQALRDKARLEDQMGEQALELVAARNHVCAAPEPENRFSEETAVRPAEIVTPETADDPELTDAEQTITELRAALAAEQGVSARLRTKLAAEEALSTGLRKEISDTTRSLKVVQGKLYAATDSHSAYVRETQATFEQRLAAGVSAAETDVRGEAVRIIEAIAADNPDLADAVDLFTVAFPAEAAPEDKELPDSPAPIVTEPAVPVPAVDFFDIPAEAETDGSANPATTAGPEAAAVLPIDEDIFNLPDPESEAGVTPMTQAYLQAPDLDDDAILDPHFFDNPEPLEAPADEQAQTPVPAENQAAVPKPSYGLFGRKKETQNV
jgi:hypothetical protein